MLIEINLLLSGTEQNAHDFLSKLPSIADSVGAVSITLIEKRVSNEEVNVVRSTGPLSPEELNLDRE